MPKAEPKNSDWAKLDPWTLGLIGLAAAFMGFVIWDQSYWWDTLDDYLFGYLVPLFVAYVIFERIPSIKSYLFGLNYSGTDPEARVEYSSGDSGGGIASTIGYLCLAGSIVLLGFSGFVRAIMSQHDWSTFGFSVGLASFILFAAFVISDRDVEGRRLTLGSRLRFVSLFTFPALIWLVSAPLLLPLEAAISTALLKQVTVITFAVFDAVGIPIIREGSILILPNGRVHVEDACSGIRSLTACIFAGSFLAAMFLDKTWKKVLMVGASMLFAFFFNIVRSIFLTGWTNERGQFAIDRDFWGEAEYQVDAMGKFVLDAAGEKIPNDLFHWTGSVHDFAGFMILGCTCVALMLLLPVFSYKMPSFEDEELPEDGSDTDGEAPTTDSKPA